MKGRAVKRKRQQDGRSRTFQGRTEGEFTREDIERALKEPLPAKPDHSAWEKELAFIDWLIRKGPIKGRRTWKREDIYDRR